MPGPNVPADEISRRIAGIDWLPLTRVLRGPVILHGDERMLYAGKQFSSGRPHVLPRALIRCRRVDDVRRALDFILGHRLPFAVRSGGHCFADLSSHSSVLIDLSDINFFRCEQAAVSVGPGTTAGEAGSRLARKGRAVPTGGCPDVALGGLSLAGGFGWLGRYYGLTLDQIERYQVVCAGGSVIEARRDENPELFWALRGAGIAGFGIVTAIDLKTRPLMPLTTCFGRWPIERAVELIDLWQRWAPTAPGRINIELSLSAPDDPGVPCVVELFGVILGDASCAREHLAALGSAFGRLAGDIRTRFLSGPRAAGYLTGALSRTGEPVRRPDRPFRETGYQFTRSDFFEELLEARTIEDCVAHFCSRRRRGQFREMEFVPWGAAYADDDGAACFIHRAPRALIRHTAVTGARATSEMCRSSRRWVDSSQALLNGHANGHTYQGYADPMLVNWQRVYYGDACPRLRQIKAKYDPDNVFNHAQSIPPLPL